MSGRHVPGTCPRCGVLPQTLRWREIQEDPSRRHNKFADALPLSEAKSSALWGTIYDGKMNEWCCLECGASWDEAEGLHCVTEDILGDGIERTHSLDRQSGTPAHDYAKMLQRLGR